jgi:hypothetical protein
MEKIIRSPRGSLRREVDVKDIQIPDLWHLAMFLQAHETEISERVGHNHLAIEAILRDGNALKTMTWSDAILETWYLANDLLENVKTDGKC